MKYLIPFYWFIPFFKWFNKENLKTDIHSGYSQMLAIMATIVAVYHTGMLILIIKIIKNIL